MRIESGTKTEFINIKDLSVGDTFCCNDCDVNLYLIVDNGSCGEIIFDEFENTKNDFVYCVNLKTNNFCRFCLDNDVIKIDSKIIACW